MPVDDEASFTAFVRAATPSLRRTAIVMVGGDCHAADDVLQIALVRLASVWPKVDNPRAWLRKVVVNLIVDRSRRSWRRREIMFAETPEESVSAETDKVDESDRMRRALVTLSARQRTAIVLRYMEDLDEVAIADAMGCSVGTVKSHLARALAHLRLSYPLGIVGREEDSPCLI